MRKILFIIILLSYFGSFSAFTQQANDINHQASELTHTIINFDADKGSLSRFYAVENSPERTARFKIFYEDYLSKLSGLKFEALSQSAKVDYILLKRKLKDELKDVLDSEKLYEQTKQYFPFANAIYELEKKRRRGITLNGEKEAQQLTIIQKEINNSLLNLKKSTDIDANLADFSARNARSLQEALRSYYRFYYGYDPMFTWWAEKPYKKVDSLLSSYSSLLRSKAAASKQKDDGSGIIGNPIGDVELKRQLEFEMIPYTAEELVEIANKEFAWCDAEILKASRELGFGDKWKDAQEKVKNSYVPPGQQAAVILRLYNESIDFIKKNNLITIPPIAEETWRMGMMSPERQLVSPFFLGGEQILISYPTNSMEQADKLMSMRGNNPHFSRSTVHHELIAGHHLQGYMNNRNKVYRNFDTPFWVEGWALYWELILWDLGFPRSAEDKIGMLFWRMHRCARIIFSLNYHLGKWTPQQCIDFLVDRVGHERANAEGEVRRSFTGGYGPLYQIAYMIGALQFLELKKELVDTKKMSYQQFHDKVIHENSMPVEMVRALLTNQPLKKDFSTQWRFYRK